MKDQADLFDNAEFVAQPVEIPANVKPTSFDEWVRQNGKQLAVKFCKEHPNFDWLIDDMHELIRINTFREFKTFMVYLDSQYEEWLKIPVKEYHANSKK